MSEIEARELRDNVMQGLYQTFENLVREKKKTNSDIAFAKNGKITKVKATEI